MKVFESAIIDAPVEEVWAVVRDFNSHRDWHPAIAESSIEDGFPVDMVGAVRAFTLADGGFLREQLVQLDDEKRELSYCLLEAPIPLFSYLATMKLKPVTGTTQTFWSWNSTFSPPAERRQELTELVAHGIYRAGMRALEAKLLDKQTRGASLKAPLQIERQHAVETTAWSPPNAIELTKPQQAVSTHDTRAIVMNSYGAPDVLQLRTVPLPQPGTGDVVVRHSCIGVNFIDVYCRTGYFNLVTLPGVPGMEAAGVVEAVGEGVNSLSIGDRVAYACAPTGAYCERRTMPAELVMRLPPEISNKTAAAGLLKGVTAGFLLHDVHPVQSGDVVVVHAAAGGVGSLLTQWAVAIGATVIATVSSREKAILAQENGAHHVIIGRAESFVETVMNVTSGRGANVIYDAVGRDSYEYSIAALRIRGHLVSYGQASGPIGEKDVGALSSKSLTVSRPNYGHYTGDRSSMLQQTERFYSALARGVVKVADPIVYPLEEAARAHADLEGGRTTGSIVLKVN